MSRARPSFLTWHFATVPKEILIGWVNVMLFVLHYFSVVQLFVTLFAPWKRQTVERKHRGFDPREAVDTLTFNLFSSMVGMVVRILVILAAIALEVVVLLLGPIVLLIALVTPAISLPTYLALLSDADTPGASAAESMATRTPEHFVTWFLHTPRGQFLLRRLECDQSSFVRMLSEQFRKVSQSEVGTKVQVPAGLPSVTAIFLSLCSNWKPLKNTIESMKLEINELQSVLAWHDRRDQERRLSARFWDRENLLRVRPIGRDWAYGYTPTLDRYATDLTAEPLHATTLVGRRPVINRIETILARENEDNVLLVGDPGVGRRTITLQLARMIAEGQVLPHLAHRRVIELNLTSAIAEAKTPEEAQSLVERLFLEARSAGNTLLVISSIDRFFTSQERRIDLSPVFARMLMGTKLQVIGITTTEEYEKFMTGNPIVGKLFEKIALEPSTKEDAIDILENFATDAEGKKRLFITFRAVKEAVEVADQYVTDIPFPEKALDILDEAIAAATAARKQTLTRGDIDRVLSEKTRVPIGEVTRDEQAKLVALEELMHKRLIDQEQAVTDLANTLRRTRLQIGKRQKPSGVFLFIGPTGVGKTETAKVLAAAYFGSESAMVRLDMNEFHDANATTRLLGDFSSREPGIMTAKLREHPFCVLLLDEIEKASPQVLNLLLTAFDEGYLADNFGKNIDLRNMMIIATSNAGSELIREHVVSSSSPEEFKQTVVEMLLREKIFTPEFLNRFDSVVVYRPLTQENLKAVARLMLDDLNERLTDKEVKVKVTDKLIDDAVRLSFDPTFGARPLRRLIQDRIEAPIAQKILEGKARRGEELEIAL